MFNIKIQLNQLFAVFLTPLLLAVNLAHAQGELRTVSVDSKTCIPREEICGSGIDEDCDGVDLKCPGDDGDRDGFPVSQDCDDGDKFVYPGVSVACKAGCGDGVKTCNVGGYTACTCTPLCEKLAGGRCFYVDPIKGNDNANGSFTSPLKTLKRVTSYSGSPPSNKIDLVPGDTIYLKSGIYNQSYMFSNDKVVLYLNVIKGTSSAPITFKSYPGEFPIFKLTGDTHAIVSIGSEWIKFQGLTIDGSLLDGIWIADGNNIELSNLIVKNTDGTDNDNLSGIKITKCNDVNLHHSILYDNFDRTNADTGGEKTPNSRNMVIFGGKNITVNNSTIFQTAKTSAQFTGSCLSYKHGPDFADSFFEVGNNIFQNCYELAIGMPGFGSHFHHNLFIDSDVAIFMHVLPGIATPSNMKENVIEFNTTYNTDLLNAQFTEVINVYKSFGRNVVKNNILHSSSHFDPFRGAYTIDPYGTNQVLQDVKTKPYLISNNNCFYNPKESIQFAYYSSSNGPNTEDGGAYDLSQWKDMGFDLNSIEVNPELNTNTFQPQGVGCADKGIYAH